MDNEIKKIMTEMRMAESSLNQEAIESEIDAFIDDNEDIVDEVECFIDKVFTNKTDRLLRLLK